MVTASHCFALAPAMRSGWRLCLALAPVLASKTVCVQMAEPVLVVGGGLAGLCASIEAARRGAKVTIIEKEAALGGNSMKASSGMNGANTEVGGARIDERACFSIVLHPFSWLCHGFFHVFFFFFSILS